MDGIVDDAIISGLLKQILMEVKSSNEMLSQKVSELEKKVCELQDDTPIPKKRKKLSPSREVRVSMLCYLVVCSPVYCYTPYFFLMMQDVVRKVYRSLMESDENFGWDLE